MECAFNFEYCQGGNPCDCVAGLFGADNFLGQAEGDDRVSTLPIRTSPASYGADGNDDSILGFSLHTTPPDEAKGLPLRTAAKLTEADGDGDGNLDIPPRTPPKPDEKSGLNPSMSMSTASSVQPPNTGHCDTNQLSINGILHPSNASAALTLSPDSLVLASPISTALESPAGDVFLNFSHNSSHYQQSIIQPHLLQAYADTAMPYDNNHNSTFANSSVAGGGPAITLNTVAAPYGMATSSVAGYGTVNAGGQSNAYQSHQADSTSPPRDEADPPQRPDFPSFEDIPVSERVTGIDAARRNLSERDQSQLQDDQILDDSAVAAIRANAPQIVGRFFNAMINLQNLREYRSNAYKNMVKQKTSIKILQSLAWSLFVCHS